MRRYLRVAAAVYYFTQLWVYGNRLASASDDWESPHAAQLIEMGLVSPTGDPLVREYVPWPRE